jgi:hypothetical protein
MQSQLLLHRGGSASAAAPIRAATARPARIPSLISRRAPPSPSPARRRSRHRLTPCAAEPSNLGAAQRPTPEDATTADDDDRPNPSRLADLRAQLALAVRDEDYKSAAALRDQLSKLESDARLALADANAAFYSAFASGDAARMERVWAEGDHVQVVHPGAPPISGRRAVDASWRAILAGVRPGAFRITAEDVRVVIAGDDVGVVTCVEVVEADDGRGRTVATNVFERVPEEGEGGSGSGSDGSGPPRVRSGPPGGRWRMTLHHGSPMAMGRR